MLDNKVHLIKASKILEITYLKCRGCHRSIGILSPNNRIRNKKLCHKSGCKFYKRRQKIQNFINLDWMSLLNGYSSSNDEETSV